MALPFGLKKIDGASGWHLMKSFFLQDYARVNGYDFVLGIKQVDPQLENMWNKPGRMTNDTGLQGSYRKLAVHLAEHSALQLALKGKAQSECYLDKRKSLKCIGWAMQLGSTKSWRMRS